MLIDGRTLETGTVLPTDVCVIGGGAAGITVARDLRGSGLDVVLIESGGLEADTATPDLAAGSMTAAVFRDGLDPDRTIPLEDTRLRWLGGTTNHWAGHCRPLQPVDFEARPGIARSGWPFGPDELDPWYRRAHEVIRLGPYSYDWEFWRERAGLSPPIVDDKDIAPVLFQVKFPYSFGAAHRDDLETATDVRVLLHGTATHLGLSADGSRIDRVDVSTGDGGNVAVVVPRLVVTALGGIDGARLLLASNDVRPEGIGNGNDRVGRYFCDHLVIPSGFIVVSGGGTQLEGYGGISSHAGPAGSESVGLRPAITLSADVMRARELTGLELQLLPLDVESGGSIQEDGLGAGAAATLVEAIGGTPVGAIAYLQASAEMGLNPENRITLDTRERDATGVPRVSVRWRPADEDMVSVTTGLHLMASALSRTGTARVQLVPDRIRLNAEVATGGPLYRTLPPDGSLDLSEGAAVGFHHMCATRMAGSPREGVVDADLRVHDVANLYIAGSSSFATPGSSTPTLTIVALALRLADHIRRELG